MAHYCVNYNNRGITAAKFLYYLYIRTLII